MAFDGKFDGAFDGGWDGGAGGPAPPPVTIGNAQWCVTVEGMPWVVTDGNAAVAKAAYPSYPTALDGLFVKMQAVSEIHPWDAFRPGGTCELHILPDSAQTDRVGKDTRRRNAGAETTLTATVDRAALSIPVKRSDDFPATPFDFYIGNECIEATAKPDTAHITANVRGKYVPFASSENFPYFAEHHRFGNYDYSIALAPEVTLYPRTWDGRWVAVRRHTKTAGVLNTGEGLTKADCPFAGVIDGGPEHDPNTGCTVFRLKHVVDRIRDTTIGREMWSGKIHEGVYLFTGDQFGWFDRNLGTTKTANPLNVVAGAPGSVNEIQAGYYTADQLVSAFNAWLASEKAAARLLGTYTCQIVSTSDGWRFQVKWRIGATTDTVEFKATLRARYAAFLGLANLGLTAGGSWTSGPGASEGGVDNTYTGVRAPYHSALSASGGGSTTIDFSLKLDDYRGILNDQQSYLPAAAGGPNVDSAGWSEGTPANLKWGMFLIDERILVRAGWASASPSELVHVQVIEGLGGESFPGPDFDGYGHQYGVDDGPMTIRQILYLEGPFGEMLKSLFYSTGTFEYNVANYDSLGYGIGLGIPWELLGTAFDQSIGLLPAADTVALWIIKEGTTIGKLLNVDCVMRRSHLIYTGSHLKWVSWSTPTAALSVHDLTDANKAEPVGNDIKQRTSTMDDSSYATPILKIDYNRLLRTDEYRGHLFIGDLTAIDNAGGAAEAKTLQAQNLFAEIDGTAAAIEALEPELVKWHPFFSQPIMIAQRSISPDLYGQIAAGDIVTLTDDDIGDPTTGNLGVTGLPGLVMKVSHDWGGLDPTTGVNRGRAGDKPRPMVGSVRVAILPVNRVTQYVPCAEFNGTDYNAGLKKITTQPHEHSEASLAVDASYFANGYAVRIVEVDPANPASPLTYLRNVSGTPSGNDITHDGVALGTGGGETAFDTTKKYRVIFQGYTASTSLQKAKCYQADDADSMIVNLAQAYRYGETPNGYTYTKSHHYDLGEKLSTLAYGDGVPLDTGFERGLARLCNNLYDHKTAKQFPMLFQGAPRVANPASGYELLYLTEVDLGCVVLSSTIKRFLYVAPWFRSSDGTAVTCRVTLCRFRPTGSAARTMDTPFPGTAVSVTFGTSSTTPSSPTSKGLDLAIGVQRTTGKAWLAIEGTIKTECRGLSEAIVREREVVGF